MNLSDDLRDSTLADARSTTQHLSPPEKGRTETSTRLATPALPKALNQWASDLSPLPSQPRSLQPETKRLELQTLKQPTDLREAEKRQDESFRKEFLQSHSSEQVGHYANPLSPLRERDMQALSLWFQRDDMFAIETDINQMLIQLLPEPCWDEKTFDFLREFL